MANNDLNNYIKAMKMKQISQIKIAEPKKKKVWEAQKGKCKKCGKVLREYLNKFDGESIICSDCYVKVPRKKS
jgi:formylmethanofuran dehydrogenase subunit E